jgi:hypothetical protein
MTDKDQPVYAQRKRSAYDHRLNYLRYAIGMALYGPNMAAWPAHAHW